MNDLDLIETALGQPHLITSGSSSHRQIPDPNCLACSGIIALARVRARQEQAEKALRDTLTLAAVANEGDTWYAENEGIDAEAVLAKAREVLAAAGEPGNT